MPNAVTVFLFLIAGFGLGLVFFGGLWLTIRAIPIVRYPTALAIASFWGRTALAVGAYALVLSVGLEEALFTTVGFFVARIILSRWIPKREVLKRAVE